MSALARILLEKGKSVSGSDIRESEAVQLLRHMGATVHIGHKAENRPGNSTTIYSTAAQQGNPELAEPLHHRSDLLRDLIAEKQGLLAAGTHGKTSTSGLLAWTLTSGGFDPSFAIGGSLSNSCDNGHHGEGEYFVAESCESDGSLIKYNGYGAIVMNVEVDHLDHYANEEEIHDVFRTFLAKPFHYLYVCGDDPFLAKQRGVKYGFSPGNTIRGANYRQIGWTSYFDIERGPTNIALNQPGKQMATNAIAVFSLCRDLGMSEKAIRTAFATFPGMKRRYESKGEKDGVLYFDDYAHHPTEVSVMLSGLKSAYPRRNLIAIFQPHRYTRLEAFMDQFALAFSHADRVIITDVHSAGEAPIPGISGETLAKKTPNAQYISREALNLNFSSGDVVVTIGAGDITKLHETRKT
jgi:UDP-N-acetylmuramate--alanine ligase